MFNKKRVSSVLALTMFITLLFNNLAFATEKENGNQIFPKSPANLRFAERTDTSVILEWDASPEGDIAEYQVYQGDEQIATIEEGTSCKIEGLTPGNIYEFRVTARDTNGNISPEDNTIGVKISEDIDELSPLPSVSPIDAEGASGVSSDDPNTFSGNVKLSVEASAEAGIKEVEFYSKTIDTPDSGYWKFPESSVKRSDSTYYANWASVYAPDGICAIRVIVRDNSGQFVTTTRLLTVNNVSNEDPSWDPAPTPPEHMIVGYVASWAVRGAYNILTDIDISRLTHINYAFGIINDDLKLDVEDQLLDPKNFEKLNELKKEYPHLKIIISVGGWGGSDRFKDVAATEEARSRFADSCVDFIIEHGLDGVDLDWEYPTTEADRHNFPLLLKTIREKFDEQENQDEKEYILSIAAGANSSFAYNSQIGESQQYLDYVQLMTYDIHGPWETKADFNAPLYDDDGATYSVDKAVQIFLDAGVTADKLVMGIPFYGYQYKVTSTENNGLRQSIDTEGVNAAIPYREIVNNDFPSKGYTYYWSEGSKVPYYFNPTTKTFISFDNPESIKSKAEYVKEKGLAGAMIWELTQDHEIDLLSVVYDSLKEKPEETDPLKDVKIIIDPIGDDGKTVRGTPQLSISSNVDEDKIEKVEFYSKLKIAPDSSYYKINEKTQFPYRVNWVTDPWVSDGEYTVRALIYDIKGNITSITRDVVVDNSSPVALLPPKNLESSAQIGTNILLSWSKVEGATGYGIYAGTEKVGQTTIAKEYMVGGLQPDTEYTFTVKAKDDKGNTSEFSAPITVKTEKVIEPNKSDLNNYVAEIISTYEIGKYPYLLNDDYENYNGVTQNIVYQDTTIARANPSGDKASHCVGITFEVFFRAMQNRNRDAGISPEDFNGMTANDMMDFLLMWYVAQGTPKSDGNQLAGAIEKYGLGERIYDFEEVQTGDFIDFSRSNSGHAAVFMNWIREGNDIIGFKYWSSQDSTKGINYKEEYFNDNPVGVIKGSVDRKNIYIGRVNCIDGYKAFKHEEDPVKKELVKAIAAAEEAIRNLPSVEEVTIEDKKAVLEAKALVELVKKLDKDAVVEGEKLIVELEKRIAELEVSQADQKAVEAVIKQINDLPDKITLKDKEAVRSARNFYNKLTKLQKALIDEETMRKLITAEAKIMELEDRVGEDQEGNRQDIEKLQDRLPKTGSNTNIGFSISGLLLVLFGLVYLKKKTA